MSATERGGGTEKFVEKKLTLNKNLLSAIYFHNSQNALSSNYRNQTKINELKITRCYECELMKPSKGIINLANLRTMFGYLLIYSKCKKFNASISMHNSHAKISHILYAQQFFLPPLICHHSINASNCSKYCN